MEAIKAGTPSTHFQAADLAARLRTLSPEHIPAFLNGLDRAAIESLWRFMPQDCRCPLRIHKCPLHAPEPCECHAIAEPCEHVEEARAQDWPLPLAAVEYLFRFLGKEYDEPPLAECPSHNTNARAQVSIFAERRRRRRQLRHPLDWCGNLQAVDERLARMLGRGRNGSDVVGPLLLESASM